MKILISSHFYYPSIGGVERFSFLMARAFSQQGHEVIIVTDISDKAGKTPAEKFEVIRQPSPLKLLKLLKWCDVYWQNSISLRHLWANTLVRKPCFITFQGPIGQNRFIKWLKYFFLQQNNVISVSHGIATLLEGMPHSVIHNAFQPDDFFITNPPEERRKKLVFVGRLIKEKGVDIVLHALAKLQSKGHIIDLTIVGKGSEESNLKTLTSELGLTGNVSFAGLKLGQQLGELINQHQIMMVPSNYPEAFGIVALEGIACGCPIIAANAYGLPEAVGKCGLLFAMGDVDDCAEKIENLVDNFELIKELLAYREKQLAEHSADFIARQYLNLFQDQLK